MGNLSREYLEELSSATFVAGWGVVATIPAKSAPLHSSSGQERQGDRRREGGRSYLSVISAVLSRVRGLRGDGLYIGGLWWTPALGFDGLYVFICLLQ